MTPAVPARDERQGAGIPGVAPETAGTRTALPGILQGANATTIGAAAQLSVSAGLTHLPCATRSDPSAPTCSACILPSNVAKTTH